MVNARNNNKICLRPQLGTYRAKCCAHIEGLAVSSESGRQEKSAQESC